MSLTQTIPRSKAAAATTREFALTDQEFAAIVARVREAAGIVLGESKRELVYGRVGRRLRALGCGSFSDYIRLLDGPDAASERVAMVNAVTTNLTGFFREPHHFDCLSQEVIPALIAAPGQQRRLRIWSAGCSSGEEPYTIAMTMHKALRRPEHWDALILASDIDTDMTAVARAGVYDAEKAEHIPAELRRRYTQRVDGGTVGMQPVLRELIRFRRLNLLESWPMQGPFDAIFCRNVVIYFDKPTQRSLFDRFAQMLRPDGWLFIGHSESLFGVSDRFQHLGRTIYRKIR